MSKNAESATFSELTNSRSNNINNRVRLIILIVTIFIAYYSHRRAPIARVQIDNSTIVQRIQPNSGKHCQLWLSFRSPTSVLVIKNNNKLPSGQIIFTLIALALLESAAIYSMPTTSTRTLGALDTLSPTSVGRCSLF